MNLPEVIRLQLKELKGRRLIYYLAIAALAFCLENAPEWLHLTAETQNAWAAPGRLFEQVYQWQATLGPRKPRSHFVRLIILRAATEPDLLTEVSNRCPQREFFSLLLPAIAAASPALIVIDKDYSPSLACPETDHLIRSAAGVSAATPIILSARSESELQASAEPEELRRTLERNSAVVKLPSLAFPNGVRQAIANLDIDDRKIPLFWPAYPDRSSVGKVKPRPEPSLAFAAATTFDPSVATLPAITNLEKHHRFAYTNFLREDQIGSYSAIDLLCNAAHSRDRDWKTCNPDPANNSGLRQLSHRVVLIGEENASDMWDSPVGRVPGAVLQANYIEALLDDRYLQPCPWWVQIILGFFVLALIDLVIEIFDVPETMREDWSRAKNAAVRLPLFFAGLLVAMILLAIAGFVLVDVSVVQFGYLPLMTIPGLLGFVLKFGERIAAIHET